MRLRFVSSALMAGVAGCFSPSFPTGAVCAPPGSSSRCPTGLQCVAHDGIETCEIDGGGAMPDAPEAEPDAVVEVDTDRDDDGIENSDDNCPDLASADQADEDGDHVGDICDLCPAFANNTDGDGDGLGDACDPNPTTAGDKLVAFVGFSKPLPAGWTKAGTFVIDDGDGVLSAGDVETSVISMASPAGPRVEIRAAFAVEAITAAGINLGSINLIERMQPATDKSVACQLSGLGNGMLEELRIFDASSMIAIESADHPFAAGTETELRLRRNGTSYACHVTGPSQELTGTSAFSPGLPRIGVRTRGAVARFHWVMVTTSP